MQESILKKIEKCLALSKSNNPHEAAIALKQANALMEKHQLTMTDVSLSKINESKSKGSPSKNAMDFEAALAQMVANIFDCKLMKSVNTRYTSTKKYPTYITYWSFIGVKPNDEIAAYTFQTLFRQLKNARQEYINTELSYYSKKTKTQKANSFCIAWVIQVKETAKGLLNKSDNEQESKTEKMINSWIEREHGKLNKSTARSSKELILEDFQAGTESAKNAVLHNAVHGHQEGNLKIEN